MHVSQIPFISTMERSDKRWAQKAREYRAAIEAKTHALITTETVVKRIALVRITTPYNKKKGESEYVCFAGQIRGIHKAYVSAKTTVVRVWAVYSVDPGVSGGLQQIQRWDHLCMAQAHRDGRNYHYAKYLMTEDIDKWTHELSNR
jgi:hypothetical protein